MESNGDEGLLHTRRKPRIMAENHQPDTGVALITGGARGIGEATARALASAGMTVVIADILDGHSVAESIGPTAMFEHLDVTDANNWQAVLSRTEERAGVLTALINNAGILDFGSIETFTPRSVSSHSRGQPGRPPLPRYAPGRRSTAAQRIGG